MKAGLGYKEAAIKTVRYALIHLVPALQYLHILLTVSENDTNKPAKFVPSETTGKKIPVKQRKIINLIAHIRKDRL